MWFEVYDAYSDTYFFYDTATGESRWTAPLNMTDLPEMDPEKQKKTPRPRTPLDETGAAMKIQGMFRNYQVREKIRAMVSKRYRKLYDEYSDTFYFYDTHTRQSQLTLPCGLKDLVEKKIELNEDSAALKIQGLFRNFVVRQKIRALLSKRYKKGR